MIRLTWLLEPPEPDMRRMSCYGTTLTTPEDETPYFIRTNWTPIYRDVIAGWTRDKETEAERRAHETFGKGDIEWISSR